MTLPRNLTLDSGALIAIEKGADLMRAVGQYRQAMRGARARITIPAPVLAQVWRGNGPRIARLIAGSTVEVFDEPLARAVGALLARSRTADIVDAVVVVGAMWRGDAIVTSDRGDIRRLLDASAEDNGGRVTIVDV